jgi:hypothetical protein
MYYERDREMRGLPFPREEEPEGVDMVATARAVTAVELPVGTR